MKKQRTKTRTTAKPPKRAEDKLPFLEHFNELKRRLFIVAVSITAFSTAAYFVQMQIVDLLLRPAKGQELIYTTPGGGLDLLFRVCLYTGIVFSIPVIVYQVLKYLEPVIGEGSSRFAVTGGIISGVLAVAGMAFGYFAGLPATLHFLFHQFTTDQIHPLIAVHSYMKFIALYMFGAALLFQVPLVLLFINRIKRLRPRTLWAKQRWMILISFCLAVIMNPTPNVMDQLMLVGPMVVMYYVGIGIIWAVNRPRRPRKVNELLALDAQVRAERLARMQDARIVWRQAAAIAEEPVGALQDLRNILQPVDLTPHPAPTRIASTPVPVAPAVIRQRKYVDGFSRPVARGRSTAALTVKRSPL